MQPLLNVAESTIVDNPGLGNDKNFNKSHVEVGERCTDIWMKIHKLVFFFYTPYFTVQFAVCRLIFLRVFKNLCSLAFCQVLHAKIAHMLNLTQIYRNTFENVFTIYVHTDYLYTLGTMFDTTYIKREYVI